MPVFHNNTLNRIRVRRLSQPALTTETLKPRRGMANPPLYQMSRSQNDSEEVRRLIQSSQLHPAVQQSV